MNSQVAPFYEVGHSGATNHQQTFPTITSSNNRHDQAHSCEKCIFTFANSEDSGEPESARSLARVLIVITVKWPFIIMNSHASPFYEVGHSGATTHPPTFPTITSSYNRHDQADSCEKGIFTFANSEDSGEPANARSLARILTVLTVKWPFSIMNNQVAPFYEVGHSGATTHPPTLLRNRLSVVYLGCGKYPIYCVERH